MTVYYERPRDFIEVRGPDAATYLQGQLSQDVEALPSGAAAATFVLQPTGKVDSWARVLRLADDVFVLDVDEGWGEGLAARLQRFLLRTKAEITRLPWTCLALRGADAGGSREPAEPGEDGPWIVPAGWPHPGEAFDLVGPVVTPPDGATVAGPDEYEGVRVAAGVPAMGSELTENTIPAEVGQWVIDTSVSFTKGCFTGQELVARVDSRGGNVPRHLRRLQLPADAARPPVGASLDVEGAEVGTVTSTAVAPSGEPVALGFVKRAVSPPVDGTLRWDGGQAPVTVAPVAAPED